MLSHSDSTTRNRSAIGSDVNSDKVRSRFDQGSIKVHDSITPDVTSKPSGGEAVPIGRLIVLIIYRLESPRVVQVAFDRSQLC